MKHIYMHKIIGWSFVFLLCVGIIFPQQTFAQTAQSGNVVMLAKDQTVNGDYFAGGQTIDIHGTVNGDLYVAGGNVEVDGTINGDILAAGGTVLLQGSAHNIRTAGGNVTIDSTVDGNVTAVGGNVTIADGAKIAGSLVSAGGQINVLPAIGKGAAIAGGQITISNTINGDLLGAGNFNLTPQAKVNGAFTYLNARQATIENGAVISGKVTHNYPPKQPQQQKSQASAAGLVGAALGFSLISLVSAFVLGLFILMLVPLFMQQTAETLVERPWLSLGIGLVAAIATPIVAFILFITVLGIPLGILMIVLYGIYAYISKIFVSFAIGLWIFMRSNPRRPHLVWSLLVGLIIYEILGLIPFIGWLIMLIFWLMGMGALLVTKREVFLFGRSKKVF